MDFPAGDYPRLPERGWVGAPRPGTRHYPAWLGLAKLINKSNVRALVTGSMSLRVLLARLPRATPMRGLGRAGLLCHAAGPGRACGGGCRGLQPLHKQAMVARGPAQIKIVAGPRKSYTRAFHQIERATARTQNRSVLMHMARHLRPPQGPQASVRRGIERKGLPCGKSVTQGMHPHLHPPGRISTPCSACNTSNLQPNLCLHHPKQLCAFSSQNRNLL